MTMFSSSKPLASLSSGLLARKGQARPAMRPQGFHGHGMNLEDLGWNDMGDSELAPVHQFAPEPEFESEPAPAPTPIVAAVPPIAHAPVVAAEVPPVLVEREKLSHELGAVNEAEVKSVSLNTAKRIQREVKACKPKAAFTLRLDAERHLRLRLAVATRNRSAQALVTEALDALLDGLPEIEELARQLPELTSVRSSGGKR